MHIRVRECIRYKVYIRIITVHKEWRLRFKLRHFQNSNTCIRIRMSKVTLYMDSQPEAQARFVVFTMRLANK